MVIWSLLRSFQRYWLIIVLGGILTVAALILLPQGTGVYSARTQLVFFAPKDDNAWRYQSQSLIGFAGVVATAVGNSPDAPKLTSVNLPLAGAGVTNGYSLTVPDTGGQWSHNFERAQIDLQVTGSETDEVKSRAAALLELVALTSVQLQDEQGVPKSNRITHRTDPPNLSITYETGSPTRARLGIVLIGATLTVSAVVFVSYGDGKTLNYDSRRGRRSRLSGPRRKPVSLDVDAP